MERQTVYHVFALEKGAFSVYVPKRGVENKRLGRLIKVNPRKRYGRELAEFGRLIFHIKRYTADTDEYIEINIPDGVFWYRRFRKEREGEVVRLIQEENISVPLKIYGEIVSVQTGEQDPPVIIYRYGKQDIVRYWVIKELIAKLKAGGQAK